MWLYFIIAYVLCELFLTEGYKNNLSIIISLIAELFVIKSLLPITYIMLISFCQCLNNIKIFKYNLSRSELIKKSLNFTDVGAVLCQSLFIMDQQWRYFSDGEHCVDFVLAYDDEEKQEDIEKRATYETNLENVGLLLEKEKSQRIHFVKIHVPEETLSQYAEILKLRLPIRFDLPMPPSKNIFFSTINKILECLHVKLDPKIFPPQKYKLTAEFSREKNYLFDVDSPDFFNERIRITIVSYILEREKYGEDDHEKGIYRLLSEGIYKAAYPLHDGGVHTPNSKRSLLLHHWAQVSKCIKYQPLDEIKDYFGVKFALYFAWLGFYTHMLIPASLVGILCLIYGATTLNSDAISQDICTLDVDMCPRCDKVCDYWKLKEGCLYAKIQHFIDNPVTIFFAVFMSIWSVLYLSLWRQYSAAITHRWGLTGFDLEAEPPRPEYLIRLADAQKRKLNVITNLREPTVSFWKVKLPSIILSFTVALMWVFIALFVVFGVVIYRMSLITSEILYVDKIRFRIYVLPMTAALINLICINILNVLYRKLAVWLTEMELQRTQTQYDDSLALKIYMFQFVNYYSSIFYIAFLKGQFVGYPAKYNRIFGFRQEECNPGGCLMELTIQLAIIMIGNQTINSVLEIVVPLLQKIHKSAKVKMGINDNNTDEEVISCNQWTEDYKLSDIQTESLFKEYLEMVLQYGFVTIFVTAFPLAPFFALINNIFEMRLDAKKFIKYFRRPVPQRVKNIGVWFPIMEFIGRVSVVSNAFIIAFSSHFIPRMVYIMMESEDHTDAGFLEHSLAYFDTKDFQEGTAPESPSYNVSICRYPEYRNPPNVTGGLIRYKRPLIYWHILAARLAFVVTYQNVVTFVVTAVHWTIPDIPRRLNDQIKREAYKTNDIIIKNEKERARSRRRRRKHRQSALSDTVYYDANGGFHSDTANPQSNPQDMQFIDHENS